MSSQDELQKKYAITRKVLREWESSLQKTHFEFDSSFIRYMVNKQKKNGYEKYNDEKLYHYLLKSDKTGELYKEAQRGMVLWNEWIDLGVLLRQLNRPRSKSV